MSKKVLILSEAIGNGHTNAAEALKQGISHLAPSIHTQIVEVGHTLHPLITKLLVNTYMRMIRLSPSIWRKIYHYEHNKPFSKWKEYFIYQLFHKNIEMLLNQENPQLIICTHPFTSSSVARLKRLGSSFTLCTVITDFHVHGAWVQPEVDVYMVTCKNVFNQLISMGISADCIEITGIPIRSNFWIKKNKQEIRKKLDLKNIPTVMIMGGGWGIGGISELAKSLLKWKENIQIIICTGNNEILRNSLSRSVMYSHPHVHILGYIEHIDEWMEITDLLITKPGGVTCFEALTKGLPVYIYQPIPGHEERNCDILVNNQLAFKIEDTSSIDNLVERLIFSPQKMEIMYDRMQQFKQKVNPLASAEFIVNKLL